MANHVWHNRTYGSIQKSGLERVIDYSGTGAYFAPVRAVILMDEDENLLGDRDSPVFVTGNVTLTDSEVFLTNNPLPITGEVFLTNNPLPITGDVFLTNDPLPITGDVQLVDNFDNVIGIRGSPVFITGHVTDDWSIITLSDLTQPDNDKTFTVPAEQEYQFLSAFVTYAAANAGGDRQLQLDFRDTDDVVVGQYRPGAVHAVNTTGYYMFAPAIADLDALRDSQYLSTPVAPTTFLSAGEDMRFFDNNAVSGSDIMGIKVRVARRRA